eukprot:gnl/Trimastix_PCT/560.p3 GENE.gnl/Trimastix_PCT/560~~gnl/Trimastix_PCT/560.p3  ORF type:complete len:180 (+),score=55.24 gnl/Trimastix_PCT/560:79-618(+)
MDPPPKRSLSKGLMQLRFMQKADIKKQQIQQQKQRNDEAHWVIDGNQGASLVVTDESVDPLLNYRPGHRSFGRFNKPLEDMVSSMQQEQSHFLNQRIEEAASIGDEEMVERYRQYVHQEQLPAPLPPSAEPAVKEADLNRKDKRRRLDRISGLGRMAAGDERRRGEGGEGGEGGEQGAE